MLRPLDSVNKALLDDTTTMGDVKTLFNAIIDEFHENANRFNSSAPIVLYLQFENAVVNRLYQDEAIAISKLIVHNGE